MRNEKKDSFPELLPLTVFLVACTGTGPRAGSSNNMLLIVGIVITSGIALLLDKRGKKTPFEEKIALYCGGGEEEILVLIILIFLLAGAFDGATKGMGVVDPIVGMGLIILLGNLILPGTFPIGCLLSFSMGTSIGTVVVLMPITVDISNKTGINVCLLVGAIVGGAMPGDNLSFISDTTIAVTRTQEASMKDKLKANILMVLPAIVINVIPLAIQPGGDASLGNIGFFSFVNIIPYILIIALSLIGLNAVVVTIIGILSGMIIGCSNDGFTLIQSLTIIHDGTIDMEDIALIAVMVGGMIELMKHFGGMGFLMNQSIKGAKLSRGGELSIAALVGLLDIATTNSTISIVTADPIARDITDNFHTLGSRVTSILNLFSSVFNGLLPYAGQLLVAGGLANVSPTAIMGYNWYPMLTIAFRIVLITIGFPKSKDIRAKKEQVEKEV